MLHKVARNSVSCRALHRYSKLEQEDLTTNTDNKQLSIPRNFSTASIISIESILCDVRDLDCQIEETGEDDVDDEKREEQNEFLLMNKKPKPDVGKRMENERGGNLITKETSETGKVSNC